MYPFPVLAILAASIPADDLRDDYDLEKALRNASVVCRARHLARRTESGPLYGIRQGDASCPRTLDLWLVEKIEFGEAKLGDTLHVHRTDELASCHRHALYEEKGIDVSLIVPHYTSPTKEEPDPSSKVQLLLLRGSSRREMAYVAPGSIEPLSSLPLIHRLLASRKKAGTLPPARLSP